MRCVKLGPSDYRTMPWKNGLGSTTELLIDPPGATLDGFRWRLSMAAVAASGPFSSFPGIDRTLLLLEGGGLELDHGGHGRARLAGPLEPAAFSGDWPTSGQLLDGPCRDFNVMSDRSQVRHEVTVLRPGGTAQPLPAADTLLLYCARGRARVAGQGIDAVLEAGELLRCDDGARLAVASLADDSALILVTVDAR
jgi:hypothetical protein